MVEMVHVIVQDKDATVRNLVFAKMKAIHTIDVVGLVLTHVVAEAQCAIVHLPIAVTSFMTLINLVVEPKHATVFSTCVFAKTSACIILAGLGTIAPDAVAV